LPNGVAGRVFALALLAAGLFLLWLAAVAPLLGWHAQRNEVLERKQALLSRMEALAASLPEWRRAREDAATQGPAKPSLLEGASDAVAAAALQGLVQDLASRTGAAVRSMEILAAEARGPYRRIAVRVNAEGQWPVMLELLRTITEASPRMLVDGLQLRGPDARSRTDEPPLAASFTVLGFRAASATDRP